MNRSKETERVRTAVALLRITIGIIILATWWENLQKGLYTGEGLSGFFNWLFDARNGNGSSLLLYKSILDATVLRFPDLFATFQMIAELLLGLALLLGLMTPIAGAAASFFFFNLMLSYWGGQEWIWIYVLLTMAALVAAITRSGRSSLGCDQLIVSRRGEPRIPFLW